MENGTGYDEIFAVWAVVIIIWDLFIVLPRKVHLSITKDGIVDSSSSVSFGLIPWQDIQHISVTWFSPDFLHANLWIDLKDRGKYLSKFPLWFRILHPILYFGNKISVPVLYLNKDPLAIEKEINEYIKVNNITLASRL